MSLSTWFLDPGWWPVLLLGPATWFVLLRLDRSRAGRLQRRIGPRASVLVQGFDPRHRRDRRLLTAAAVLCAGFALMRPTWGEVVRRYENRGSDILICLDVSRSMLARDVKPSRFERARDHIIGLLREVKNERVGLVVFAGEARLISPLTRDLSAFNELLGQVDFTSVRQGGTDVGQALALANSALGDARESTRVIFLLSDGEDLEEGRTAGSSEVPVFAVGYGTAQGGKIPVPTEEGEVFLTDSLGDEVVTKLASTGLQKRASDSGGLYLDCADQPDPLRSLLERQVRPLSSAQMLENSKAGRDNYYQWPLLLAFILLVFELSWGDRRMR